jgi:hypothetical protein
MFNGREVGVISGSLSEHEVGDLKEELGEAIIVKDSELVTVFEFHVDEFDEFFDVGLVDDFRAQSMVGEEFLDFCKIDGFGFVFNLIKIRHIFNTVSLIRILPKQELP